MAKKTKTDPAIPSVGIEAKLTERGVSLGIRSRMAAAFDRLWGSRANRDAAAIEGEELVEQARSEAKAAIIAAAGAALVEQIKSDPQLALSVLSGSIDNAFREQSNRENVLKRAIEHISEQDYNSSDEKAEINDDFLSQMHTYASMASTKDMQEMLAKLLAGEITSPGSIKKRSIRLMFELDKFDAEFFQFCMKYKSLDLNQLILPPDFLNKNFDSLLQIQDAGLISDVGGDIGYDIEPKNTEMSNGNMVLTINYGDKDKTMFIFDRIKTIPLTNFGTEVASILKPGDPSHYLMAIASQLRSSGLVESMSISKSIEEGGFRILIETKNIFVNEKPLMR